MRKAIRKAIVIILALTLAGTTMPCLAVSENTSAAVKSQELTVDTASVTPQLMTDAISKFTDALTKFTMDTSDKGNLTAFMTRFGGFTAAASGVVGVLQMCGIVKDPTHQKLNEILGEVKSIQDQLNSMDKKLDEINKNLIGIAVKEEENNRNNNAKAMLKNWREFNRDYCEPLDDMINEYQGKIRKGVKAWWKEKSHEGVRVLYAQIDKKTVSLTYSLKGYEEGVPQKADNGETISVEDCVGVPAEWIPDTANMRFSVDTYQKDFETQMAKNFMEAADKKQLEVSPDFYDLWDWATSAGKQEIAESYAHDVMNTLLYRISCDVMSDNDDWVISVSNAYRKYCDNILQKDSGVDAMLNAMYLTHGFEGEIKTDIEDFCDAMVAKTGFYGQFALTCAGQDDMQSLANKQAMQANFTNTILRLAEKKKLALTGHDNYCYITGTLVGHNVIEALSDIVVETYNGDTYKSCTSSDWTITVPQILDSVYTQVLYDQYRALDHGKKAFSSYLKAYGAFPTDNWNGEIMTRYAGAETFPLSEGIRMKADAFYAGEDYFRSGSYYNIDVGTGGKVEWQYYHVHDKVLFDGFNFGTGNMFVNKMAGARAFYGETHGYWTTDETWVFATDGTHYGNKIAQDGKTRWRQCKFRARFNVLELTPVKDLNGEEDPNDPFFAFGAPSLTKGVSDYIGPSVMDKRSSITGIKLKNTAYTYTGKGIRPGLTVRAGKKKVPASGYKVSYMDNKAIGTATVTVKGKGKYRGSASMTFQIVPKGTAIKKIKRTKKTATIKWKKQKARMPSKRITGYQIRYSTDASMKNARTVKVRGYKKTSKKIRKLKKNKKYYFQVRTYMTVKKATTYSKWSKKKRC